MSAPPATGRRLLVTGASGFIGSAILRAARGRIRQRIGFCRRPAPVDDVEMIAGDAGDRRRVDEAMRGATVVIHAAGLAHRTSGLPPSAWTDANVTGTRTVVEAAVAAGVSRIVCVSSVSVYGSHDHVVTEETPCRPVGPYASSKHDAEVEARRIAAGAGVPLCVVRPATVIGPGDPGSVARLARLLHRRRFVARGDGRARKCLIGVTDVAEACLRIATAEPPDDDTYNLAGPPVHLEQIVRVLADALGAPEPRVKVPQRIVEWTLAGLSRVEPYSDGVGWVAHGLRAWLADHVYDVSRYEARYGRLARTDWRAVLRDEARWLRTRWSGAARPR
ncbi:MAG: NAD-dependent epimerase/dehydratase family protein [Vicinamibacterales bacterium]